MQSDGTEGAGTSSPGPQPVLKLSVEEFNRITAERLPFADILGIEVDSMTPQGVVVRARFKPDHLRPGGTIAGPVMMGLADAAAYALVLSRIGPVELAVTSHLSINFLSKPGACDVVAEGKMLKLGKRLAVTEVFMFSGQLASEPVAHATVTYAIPTSRQDAPSR